MFFGSFIDAAGENGAPTLLPESRPSLFFIKQLAVTQSRAKDNRMRKKSCITLVMSMRSDRSVP